MSNPTGKGGFQERKNQINRKGRPKDFTGLRSLAQMIANEVGATDENGTPHTNAEMALRKLLKEETVKFLEVAYGKVPQPVDVTSGGEKVSITLIWPEGDK